MHERGLASLGATVVNLWPGFASQYRMYVSIYANKWLSGHMLGMKVFIQI